MYDTYAQHLDIIIIKKYGGLLVDSGMLMILSGQFFYLQTPNQGRAKNLYFSSFDPLLAMASTQDPSVFLVMSPNQGQQFFGA